MPTTPADLDLIAMSARLSWALGPPVSTPIRTGREPIFGPLPQVLILSGNWDPLAARGRSVDDSEYRTQALSPVVLAALMLR